jgi:long-chain fatty acid transport protein
VPFEGVLKDRVALGVGFFTPFDLVVRGRILYGDTPQFLVPDRTQSVAVQAAMGIDVGHGIRLGAGFAALAALSGTVDVATDASGRIGTVVGDTLVASYGPIVGATYDLSPKWRLGAVFRGELVGRFNVLINVKDLGSITVPPLNISGVPQYDPMQIGLELARVDGPWRGAIGAVYKHWSAYPGAEEATVRCPVIDPMTLGPFTDSCTAPRPPPPRYSDTVSVHAGVERDFVPARGVTIDLRGGAFFEPSPAPEQTGSTNVLDNARVALTAGYGLRLGAPFPPVALDTFVQAQLLVPRDHVKANDVPAANPGSPKIETSGAIGAAGMTAEVRF